MPRKGQRVTTLTKKVGQAPREGTVVDARDDLLEVEWDDGHVTTVTSAAIVEAEMSRRIPRPQQG